MITAESKLTQLPRGGAVLHTSEGPIQFGVPPETIKDTMVMDFGVPNIFVLPMNFFHLDTGVSVAEMEFPIYFNFFIRKQKTTIVCEKNRIEDIKLAMTQAAFGPDSLDIKSEYPESTHDYFIPDISKEQSFFRGSLKLGDLFEIIPFDDNSVSIGNVKINFNKDNNEYVVLEGNEEIAQIPNEVKIHDKFKVGLDKPERFIPPRMGVTCLGPSHGFDPTQNTSGFILWLNNRGIVIDPPVGTTDWLRRSNVNPKYIDTIILTHCHSDHDAGTFQKILAEEKVNIYTTQTVMSSFLKKYSSLTKIAEEQLLEMFNFCPVSIEDPIMIHQGIFGFFYAFHAIPTIGFKVSFRGKTFVYSSDHLNSPEHVQKAFDEGFISESRKDFLMNFPWDADLIYHEAGIPPLHTPIAYLNTLPEEVQKKTVVYHIAQKDFPEDSNLSLAKFGIENTRIVEVPEHPFDEACDVLNILEKVEYFNDFTLPKISELLGVLKWEHIEEGKEIVKKGSAGDKFYIIVSGKVSIESDNNNGNEKKIYSDYDTFGEVSLLLDEYRQATVIAETDVELLTIEKSEFKNLLRGTALEERLLNLSQLRDAESWDTLNHSPLFKKASSFQKTAFEAILKPYIAHEGEVLIERGKPFEYMYLIREGCILQIVEEGVENKKLGKGYLVGNITQLQNGQASPKTYQAETNTKLYRIPKKDMIKYIQTYPNVYMNLIYR